MRIKPFVARILPSLAIALLSSGPVVVASDSFYLTTIPILLVASPEDKPIRVPSYVVIQVVHLWQPAGPEVLFNEGARGLGAFQGSVFSADWKEAAGGSTDLASDAQRGQSRLHNEWTECQCRFSYRDGGCQTG